MERPDEIIPLQKEKEGHPKGWSSIIELIDYTGDLWAAVEDRFGKINRREELRKEEKYLPEKNCCRGGGRVPRKAECAK